jgi:hypothetical protein
MIRLRSDSDICRQFAISVRVRPQPTHRVFDAFSWQILTQGVRVSFMG